MDYTDLMKYPYLPLREIGEDEPIAIDTETLGKTSFTNIPIYYSFAFHGLYGAGPTTTRKGFDFLYDLCNTPNPKVFHNAKFDLSVLERAGIEVKGEIHDTILMHMLIDEHHLEAHRLKPLTREVLGRPRLDELALRRAEKASEEVPQQVLHDYAQEDARDTLDLFNLFKETLRRETLWELYKKEVEVELVYKKLGENGVMVNVDAIERTITQLEKASKKLAEEVYDAFGKKFLITSSQQLGGVLKASGFPLREKTPTGRYKTSKDVLRRFISDPKIQLIFAHKFLTKAKGTIEGYKRRISERRLHPSFRQTTVSGRCACSNPNLTTIPKQRGRITEVEVGSKKLATLCSDAFRQTRKVFCASEGSVLISLDYKQIEYRCFAYYTGSERLLEELRTGRDFHSIICQKVFGEVNPRLRHIAKIINYGLLYGMGKRLLTRTIRDEGINPEGVLREYEKSLPEMRMTQKAMINTGKRRGYIVDVFGRRYRFRPDMSHAIVSWICQGTAANIKKEAMRRTAKILKNKRSLMVLDIHDEIVFEYYPENRKLLCRIKEEMERFPQFEIPIPVDLTIGENLLEQDGATLNEAVARLERITDKERRLKL